MKKAVIVIIILLLIALFSTPLEHKLQADDNNQLNLSYYEVDIKGDVLRPMRYQVPSGTKVKEAVILAGITPRSVFLNEEKIITHNQTIVVKERVSNPVKINQGRIDELKSLPGIGEVTLNKILRFLEMNSFKSWEEFSNITGIKNEKLLEIKARAVI